jgi:hypothetical protein
MAALKVVETLDVLEDRAPRGGAGRPTVPVEQVELSVEKKLSATALSNSCRAGLGWNEPRIHKVRDDRVAEHEHR